MPRVVGAALGVESLARLDSVELGMGAARLLRVRDSLQDAPYIGFEEVIGQDTVRYHFAEGTPISVEDRISIQHLLPDNAAPLLAVEAYTVMPSTAAADSLWRERVVRLAGIEHGAVDCFRYTHGQTPAMAALHQNNNGATGVIRYAQTQERDIAGAVIFPAVVRTFITSDLPRFVPSGVARRTTPCPQ